MPLRFLIAACFGASLATASVNDEVLCARAISRLLSYTDRGTFFDAPEVLPPKHRLAMQLRPGLHYVGIEGRRGVLQIWDYREFRDVSPDQVFQALLGNPHVSWDHVEALFCDACVVNKQARIETTILPPTLIQLAERTGKRVFGLAGVSHSALDDKTVPHVWATVSGQSIRIPAHRAFRVAVPGRAELFTATLEDIFDSGVVYGAP